MKAWLSVLAIGVFGGQQSASSTALSGPNPIRKVVNLLNALAKEVEEESLKEDQLYDKHACYCKATQSQLSDAIKADEETIPKLEGKIKETTATLSRFCQEIDDLTNEVGETTAELKKPPQARDREDYESEAADLRSSIAALKQAIPILKQGQGSQQLLSLKAQLQASGSSRSQQVLSAISQQSPFGDYSPQSLEVLGMLAQMLDNFEQDLAQENKREEAAAQAFDELHKSKTEEKMAAEAALKRKSHRHATLQMKQQDRKTNLKEAQERLAANQHSLQGLVNSCETKAKEREARAASRSEEFQAISETVKLINDDDALDLFKKTVPAPSLIQLDKAAARHLSPPVGLPAQQPQQLTKAQLMQLAASLPPAVLSQLMQRAGIGQVQRQGQPRVKGGSKFAPVARLVDRVLDTMADEQHKDDQHRDYCSEELANTRQENVTMSQTISQLLSDVETVKEEAADAAAQMQSIQAAIVQIDGDMKEAQKNRAAEEAEYENEGLERTQAEELLGKAKNRIAQYYAAEKLQQQVQGSVHLRSMCLGGHVCSN
ncbi:unnamed protein product [Vitrella brassicaformis CCMP3155]|uniref:Uncharacterized protein n=1 Tax=Vitrella brassicaformis (strain CCMP3155) TaxID=1169540 RepID=A0A0G4EGU7_VITBC|nr:unnamed protein product [Vitrella brassicaformis CCMP3155]|eukprot:CEL94730.1 unnamed protein product [Vitrella brassicaformis CCMP3155]